MRARSSTPGAFRLMFKALTALLVAAAWGALGYGLVFSRPDVNAWDELDAGGRFGINLSVYLPYYALSLPIVAVVTVSLFPRPYRMFPLAGAIGLTGLLAFWILASDLLLVAQPELATSAIVGLGLTTAATATLLTAHHLKAQPAAYHEVGDAAE